MFDKSEELFPIKKDYMYLTHCGVSPLYSHAFEKLRAFSKDHMQRGCLALKDYIVILDSLRASAAQLLKTSPDNVAFVKNTSEGMCMVANGYPFESGDQIVSYVHEYPANHYPWRLQEKRGAELILLPNRDMSGSGVDDLPCGFSMSDLEEHVTGKTKIVALSHVQFTSGFAVDLKELGTFCAARSIDLVIDAAQSLGCLPIYPEECNISAIASSGWKWLMGPVGTGLLYTSEVFREKLEHVMVGVGLMRQGTDYLDHTWDPVQTARRFEYSTSPVSLAAALEVCIKENALQYGVENIQSEIFCLQDMFIDSLDSSRYSPVVFPEKHRSGILAVICKEDPQAVAHTLQEEGIICSSQGGYLRLAPHFYNTEDEIREAVAALNSM